MYPEGIGREIAIDPRELLMSGMLRIARRLRMDRMMRAKGSAYAFTDYFKGLEKVKAVRGIFGEKTEGVLRDLKVEFTWFKGYMWVNSSNGHLMISAHYLNTGDKTDIYLDLIHELVHIKQFMEGKELFDENYSYAERPTEIEAYSYTVAEARNLGLSDERICNYLKTEWMSAGDLARLAEALNVKCAQQRALDGKVRTGKGILGKARV